MCEPYLWVAVQRSAASLGLRLRKIVRFGWLLPRCLPHLHRHCRANAAARLANFLGLPLRVRASGTNTKNIAWTFCVEGRSDLVVRVGHSLGLAVHRVYILEFFAIPSTQPAAVSYCNSFPRKSVQSLARLPVMWMVRVRFREWAHCHITCNLFFARLIASYFYAGSETGHYQSLLRSGAHFQAQRSC